MKHGVLTIAILIASVGVSLFFGYQQGFSKGYQAGSSENQITVEWFEERFLDLDASWISAEFLNVAERDAETLMFFDSYMVDVFEQLGNIEVYTKPLWQLPHRACLHEHWKTRSEPTS